MRAILRKCCRPTADSDSLTFVGLPFRGVPFSGLPFRGEESQRDTEVLADLVERGGEQLFIGEVQYGKSVATKGDSQHDGPRSCPMSPLL